MARNRKSQGSFGKDRLWKAALILLPGCVWLCACGDFTLFGEEGARREEPPDAPVARAVVSPEAVGACESATVTMNGAGSTGEGRTYSWVFTHHPPGSKAAGWSSTDATAEFKPDWAGEYKVELTVSNAGGSDSEEKTFVATSAPIASARADPKHVVVGTVGTLDGSGSKNPNPENPEDVCTPADLDFLWSLKNPDGEDAKELLGGTRTEMNATISPQEGAMLGVYTATLKVEARANPDARGTATESVTVKPALEQLEGREYAFEVRTVEDTVFGLFGIGLLPGTSLGAIHVPDVTAVPYQDTLGFTDRDFWVVYTLSGEVALEIRLADASDTFYTLSPPEGEDTPAWVRIKATSSECTVDFGRMEGKIVPQTTREVTLELTLEEVTATGGLCALLGLGNPSDTGAIELTLEGTCQDCSD